MYTLRTSRELSSIYLLKAGIQHPTCHASVGTSTTSLATWGFLNNLLLTGYEHNFCISSSQKKKKYVIVLTTPKSKNACA